MRSNEIKIFLEDYHFALLSSSNDEQWLSNSIKYPEIFQSYFETKYNIDVISDNLMVENIIKNKNKNNLSCVPQNVIEFQDNKKEFVKNNIDEVYQQTSYYASILEKLINEFSHNVRKFGSFKIYPMPETEQDTYLPIKKFKMVCKNGNCKAAIARGGSKIDGDDEMADYFQKRMISKFMKTGFLDQIPDEKENKKRLIFMKSIPLDGITNMSKKQGKFKLKFLGNQTVDDGENEFSITNEPICVTHIGKV